MSEEAELRIAEAVRTGATELDLSGLGLAEVPKRLREATRLVDLDLSHNRIAELPDYIGELHRLRIVNFQANALTGLPPQFGDLTELTRLQLHGNRLIEVPEALGRLVRLEDLVLGGNRIEHLPAFLFDLTALSFLDLFGNKLTAIPAEIARLQSLTVLDLGNNRLTALPESIGDCTGLTRVNLSGNLLRGLPATFGALRRLAHLDLSRNRLERLPDTVTDLENLTHIDLYRNLLNELPGEIRRLGRLAHLNLSDNRLERLPDDLGELNNLVTLNLRGNRLTDVPLALSRVTGLMQVNLDGNDLPPELAAANAQGTEAVLTYFREQKIDTVTIRRTKLVVLGEGAVGKSSLLAAMRGERFLEKRPLTHGLEIRSVDLTDRAGLSLELNAWDFGGQSTERPFHQLFFTTPAIYIVAWNPRRGAAQDCVEYWVNLVRQRVGEGARIHIVATHADEDGHLGDLDRTRLEREHGDCIAGFHRIDSRTRSGIDELSSALAETAVHLPHLERRLPARWHALMEELSAGGKSHLGLSDYLEHARDRGLDADSALSLAKVATELGRWCYFPDVEVLRDLVILQSDRLSRAVSLALEDPETRERNGLVHHNRLAQLWSDLEPPENERYPDRLYSALVELMHEFEIAYPVGDSREGPASLITRLVSTEEPDLGDWDRYGAGLPVQSYFIEFRDAKRRPVIPEGLMYRMIARFHRFALRNGDPGQGLHWASGMVLDDGHHGRALVRVEDERLEVTVKAAYPTFLCKLIADDVCNHLNEWKGLTPSTLVPCGSVCAVKDRDEAGSMRFDLGRLQSLKAEGDETAACSVCNKMVPLDPLIGEFGVLAATRSDPDGETVAELQAQIAALAARIGSLPELVKDEGARTRSHMSDEARRTTAEVHTRIDEQFQQFFDLFTDEGRNGPRLFTVEKIEGTRLRGLAQHRIRVVLYCERSRKPVHLLDSDPDKGVYTFDVDQEWLTKARPWIDLTARLLRLGGDIVPPALKLGLEETTWKGVENEVGLTAAGVKELASGAADFAARESIDPELDGQTRFDEHTRGQIRRLHMMLERVDPDFAGLHRIHEHGSFLWAHDSVSGHHT